MKTLILQLLAFLGFVIVPAPVSVTVATDPLAPRWVSRTKVRIPNRSGNMMSFKVIAQEGDEFILRQPNGRKAFMRHLPELVAA